MLQRGIINRDHTVTLFRLISAAATARKLARFRRPSSRVKRADEADASTRPGNPAPLPRSSMRFPVSNASRKDTSAVARLIGAKLSMIWKPISRGSPGAAVRLILAPHNAMSAAIRAIRSRNNSRSEEEEKIVNRFPTNARTRCAIFASAWSFGVRGLALSRPVKDRGLLKAL